MKAYSKFLSILVAIILVFSSISAVADTTTVQTPDNAVLKWATQIGSGWQKPAGVPVFVNDDIIIMSGDELYVVEAENGEITQKITMAEAQSYGYVAPTFADNSIFVNLSKGTVQAFDAQTLKSKWIYSDASGGKGMTKVTYSDKTVFTGFWNGETADASFVALDSETGSLKWSLTVNGGFYWAGACCTENAVIFATDDGNDKIAHVYSCDKETGKIISCIDVENKGDIRSSVVLYNDRVYATTKGGYIISAALNNDILSDVKYGEIGAASTSTPVIYKNRIYIGAGDKTISVFNADTLAKILSVPVKAYPQCTPLLSTAYEDIEGYLYLYTTYNSTPGGVTMIKIKPDATSAEECVVTELYDAEGYSQYCISDIISDNDGNLYYKNDSGYLFALEEKSETVSVSLTEEGFILPPTDLKVKANLAESYGYTDNISNAVSALDVLVKVHENIFGSDFTPSSATDYLIVSAEGYLSRIAGVDTYNFGYAINGKAPHDDVLTEYGYTGYSVNQAAVKSNDKVEFFIYRDSWAMDNYAQFTKDNICVNKISLKSGEEASLSLKGYTFAWYSCSDDATINSMTAPIKNAEIFAINTQTGVTEALCSTDTDGEFTVGFSDIGRYIIYAKEGTDDTYPLITPWIEVEITGINVNISENTVKITSCLEKETDATVVIAEYSGNMVTGSIVSHITMPKNYSDKEIDISKLTGDIKVFIWDENLTPIN